jgi:protein gp37
MGLITGISWCHHTFNPWWGCRKVSAGCDSCYAKEQSGRYGHDVWDDSPRRVFGERHWNELLRWNKSHEKAGDIGLVFCGSMCDIMDAEQPELLDPLRETLWEWVRKTPHLHYQFLTKRPNLILKKIPQDWITNPPPNVYWGTSVEDERVYWRVPELLKVPAAVHWLSVEPMIGPVSLTNIPAEHGYYSLNALTGEMRGNITRDIKYTGWLNWVVYGGESAQPNCPPPRRMDLEWVINGINECRTHGAEPFVKQMGHVLAREIGLKGKGGNPEEWPKDLQVQNLPRYYQNAMAELGKEVPTTLALPMFDE